MLVLKSDDRQALDVLTGQNALSDRRRPFIWMRRTSRARIGVQDVGIAIAIPGQEQNRPLSIAFWSAPQEVGKNAEGNTRTLYGELSLPADLIPSFTFGRKFEMSVSCCLSVFAVIDCLSVTSGSTKSKSTHPQRQVSNRLATKNCPPRRSLSLQISRAGPAREHTALPLMGWF